MRFPCDGHPTSTPSRSQRGPRWAGRTVPKRGHPHGGWPPLAFHRTVAARPRRRLGEQPPADRHVPEQLPERGPDWAGRSDCRGTGLRLPADCPGSWCSGCNAVVSSKYRERVVPGASTRRAAVDPWSRPGRTPEVGDVDVDAATDQLRAQRRHRPPRLRHIDPRPRAAPAHRPARPPTSPRWRRTPHCRYWVPPAERWCWSTKHRESPGPPAGPGWTRRWTTAWAEFPLTPPTPSTDAYRSGQPVIVEGRAPGCRRPRSPQG